VSMNDDRFMYLT